MPLYEYECDACGHRFELIQKFSDPPEEECPVCGGSVQKLVSSPAIHFKGSGWYITDYGGRGKEPTEGKDAAKPSSEGKDSEKPTGRDKDAATPEAASAGKKDGEKKETETGRGGNTAPASSSPSAGTESPKLPKSS